MVMTLNRRTMLLGGGMGLGMLMLPGGHALAAQILSARGFTHNVASGEPGPESMLLWTRFVPEAGAASVVLEAQISDTLAFTRVIAGGVVRTGGYRDWTAKITLDGLEPGRVYYYRFIAPDGSISPVGRTKTLPVGKVDKFGLGLFSCSNLPTGYFTAYAHAAERNDLDLWLHVGDYIYEYGPPASLPAELASRIVEPAHEMVALADYRLRFACYRADPDLQRLHQVAPMIALWDDHESTNDSHEAGAQNHTPATEGDWDSRKAFAMQAYREWLPISDEPWKAYPIGDLATVYRTESRLLARTEPADIAAAFRAANPDAALAAFRDGKWQDASATMLGSQQEHWLSTQFQANGGGNAATGAWQIVGMATIIGRTVMPQDALSWLHPNATERVVASMQNNMRAARHGLPMWMDRWDGYPAARARLLRSAQEADANLVMLSGDSHNAWAYSLVEDGLPAGVDFGGQSVTSNGMENSFAAPPRTVAKGFIDTNPELVWADTSQRGYVMITIQPEEVSGEYIFMRSVRERSTTTAGSHTMRVKRGRKAFEKLNM